MDLLFHYEQFKVQKKNESPSYCEFRLYEEGHRIMFLSTFDLHYHRWGVKKYMLYNYSFIIDTNTGDIEMINKIINDRYNQTGFHTTKVINKKNDFNFLNELIHNSIIKGENKINFWGVKFNRAMEKMFKILHGKLKDNVTQDFLKTKEYQMKYEVNSFYDFLVDYHLDKKGIKGHDNVYHDIQYVYPKKKWLKQNENKFLPATLDSLGIKTKHFISMINQNNNINILSLNYLCKLFGDNYIDYINQIDWVSHTIHLPHNKKTHTLKNESEKKHMIMLIDSWFNNEQIMVDSLLYNVNNLLSVREKIEEKGIDVKFKVKNYDSLGYTMESWMGILSHFKNGYKMKYIFPSEYVNEIETEIISENITYKPRLLTTEEDFKIEGSIMKNCMGKQFNNGQIYQYVSMETDKKRVNLQFKNGNLINFYGKANTDIPPEFTKPIEILESKFKIHKDMTWTKEKYDFLK